MEIEPLLKKLEDYKIEFNENAKNKFTVDKQKLNSLRNNINSLKSTIKNLENLNVTLAPEQYNLIENASEMKYDNVMVNLTFNSGAQYGGHEEATRRVQEEGGQQGARGEEGQVRQRRHQGEAGAQRPEGCRC